MGGFSAMGIVNVTPDSFSDGGRHLRPDAAVCHARRLVRDGATIVDLGGESTRPGAAPVAPAEELRRVIPVVEALTASDLPAVISVDTSKYEVAAAAIAAGASMINDVTALRRAPAIAELVAAHPAVRLCLMHMQGEPRTMQQSPRYTDVVSDVKAFLHGRLTFATAAGVPADRILLDPGIGFGKTDEHNVTLLGRLGELTDLGCPIMVGASRKSFLGRLTGRAEPADRVAGTVAANVIAYQAGASVFRVHDVPPLIDALTVAAATMGADPVRYSG